VAEVAPGIRGWLVPAGGVLAVAVAVPPVGSYARHYAFVQAAQFVVFAVVVPLLLVAGWRDFGPGARIRTLARMPWLRRRDGAGARIAAARLVPFAALVIAWRLPAVLHALAADPALTAAEAVTLTAAGAGVWVEVAGPAPPAWPLPYPLRASMAAISAWTIWVVAYITGMSAMSLGSARPGAAALVSAAADRQIAVAVMWAVPALCFAPFVYGLLMAWAGDRDDPDEELRGMPADGAVPGTVGGLRPPRGWRSPGR
jgi:Cytochrome c oxidase caa3 assembly factor (Caa3_CtaG)